MLWGKDAYKYYLIFDNDQHPSCINQHLIISFALSLCSRNCLLHFSKDQGKVQTEGNYEQIKIEGPKNNCINGGTL